MSLEVIGYIVIGLLVMILASTVRITAWLELLDDRLKDIEDNITWVRKIFIH